MATINDIVITDEQIDDADLETSEGPDIAKAVVGITALAAVAVGGYFGLGRLFGNRQEQREIALLNDLHERIAIMDACDTPVAV